MNVVTVIFGMLAAMFFFVFGVGMARGEYENGLYHVGMLATLFGIGCVFTVGAVLLYFNDRPNADDRWRE